jgi:zinc/manganese transport system permease protein
MSDLWSELFSFANYGELLVLVRNSILAGAVLGLAGGLVGVFVMARDLPFAVHGISELSFAGAAAALLAGISVVAGSLLGSLLAALVIGVLGVRARDRNAIIGVLMPFGLGLGVLFLALYSAGSRTSSGCSPDRSSPSTIPGCYPCWSSAASSSPVCSWCGDR